MNPRPYQTEALDWLEKFWSRCHALGHPRDAYAEVTREWCGTALHYAPLPSLPHHAEFDQVPSVCLRIPTGGGKTLVGGLAIARANRSLLHTRHSLTLWLVPTEPIREQTLRQLRTPGALLHTALAAALGEVTVLDVEEALRLQPAELDATNTILVATMQAFKQEDTARLSVYKQNGQLMPHFAGVSDPAVIGRHSLVDVLRMRRPFIIVDEAHNQGTELAFDTLARLEPSALLELTATPDRTHQPSNVLFSVSAATLHAANMIKLPLELTAHPQWQHALRDALACLDRLQKSAEAERAETTEYLRPILLLQAERRDAHHETFTPERVKRALIDDFGMPEAEIKIATGALDELGSEDVLTEKSRVRCIITVDKLREGWDCPFAYVLCTFRASTSATAVEQILGRILRMPNARRKRRPELNMAYAFATSTSFQETAESLRDGLVRSGFERQETRELIHAAQPAADDELFAYAESAIRAVTFALPAIEREQPPPQVPASLAEKVELSPETGCVTFKGQWSARQEAEIEKAFVTPAGKAAAREALQRLKQPAPPKRPLTPSELGELFRVPLLAYRNGELWEDFEETHLLEGEWRLVDFPTALHEAEFPRDEHAAQRGRLTVNELGKLKLEYFDRIDAQMALFDFKTSWPMAALVSWLERNTRDFNTTADDKAAFLLRAVSELMEVRKLTMDELVYRKFRLRAALEEKMTAARATAVAQSHGRLLDIEDNFRASDEVAAVFEPGRYDYDKPYAGFTELPKHFYPVIGNLESEGEEFECAVFLATQLQGVRHWLRNVERKPGSISLQTKTDRFYPDFIVQLDEAHGGKTLAVEYKNTRDWDLPDNQEKRVLGDLWERRSSGRCLFIMPCGQDWAAIRAKIAAQH